MGSPLVVYLFGAKLLLAIGALMWIAICTSSWQRKCLAMVYLAAGVAVASLLSLAPNYLSRQGLVEGLSLLALVASLTVNFFVLKRKP